MNVEREEREIERVINLFPKITGISDKKRERFEALAARFQEAQDEHSLITSQRDLRIEELRDRLEVSETQFTSSETEFKSVRQWIERGLNDELSGRLPVIVNRIRVLLSTAKLPWIITPLRRFALHEHPDILAALGERQASDNNLQAARGEFERGKEAVQKEFEVKIDEASARLAAREKTLINFADEQAITSRDAALFYAQNLPERTNIITRLYAQEKASSASELIGFVEFIRGRLTGATARQIEVWYSRWEWFVHGRSPSTDEYNLLPKNIKDDWKKYVEEKFLEDVRGGWRSL